MCAVAIPVRLERPNPQRSAQEMGRNEDRGRDRDRRSKQSEPRREDLEDTVRRQGEELQDLRTQLQRTSKLTVFTARDMGEAKAALQIAVFLTGLFREHLQGILQAYQTARDQARDGGGASSTGSARVEPLKVLLYNGMIKYLVEYAEKSFPAAVGKCQEIAGFLAGRDVLAIGNTNNPPQMDAPWVLIVTFSGSARGREMRALWDCEEIQAMAQKRGGLWPEFGIKPGSWRPSQLYSEVASDAGLDFKGKGKSKGKVSGGTGVKRRSETPDMRGGDFSRRKS